MAALVGSASPVVLVAVGALAILAAVICVVLTFLVRVGPFHGTLTEQRPLLLRPLGRGLPGSSPL